MSSPVTTDAHRQPLQPSRLGRCAGVGDQGDRGRGEPVGQIEPLSFIGDTDDAQDVLGGLVDTSLDLQEHVSFTAAIAPTANSQQPLASP